MIIVINLAPDIEEIFQTELMSHLSSEVKFAKIFPNFGNVNVSGTHPFAYLVNKQINPASIIPTNLFPSITICHENDRKNPTITIQTLLKDVEIKLAEIEHIINNRELYIISDDDVKSLQDLVAALPEGKFLSGEGVQNFRRGDLALEIWADNPKVKNKLYDLTMLFLEGKKRFTIMEAYNIVTVEDSLSGEKSGSYNMEFGRIIYGGMIRLNIDYYISQYIVDTDLGILAGVDHFDKNINP